LLPFPFSFSRLDGPNATFRFQDVDEFSFNFGLFGKLETFHASEDLSIQIIRPEGSLWTRWIAGGPGNPRTIQE
jgi:hypothetical protein